MTICDNEQIPGFSSSQDLKVIADLAKHLQPNSIIVELGTFLGRTAYAWAKNMPQGSKLYCIDNSFLGYFKYDQSFFDTIEGTWPQSFNCLKLHLGLDMVKYFLSDFDNVELLCGQHLYNVFYDKEPVDLVFIDADHEYDATLKHLEYFWKFMKPNSIICGHDYDHITVAKAVDFFARSKSMYVEILENTSIWKIEVSATHSHEP